MSVADITGGAWRYLVSLYSLYSLLGPWVASPTGTLTLVLHPGADSDLITDYISVGLACPSPQSASSLWPCPLNSKTFSISLRVRVPPYLWALSCRSPLTEPLCRSIIDPPRDQPPAHDNPSPV